MDFLKKIASEVESVSKTSTTNVPDSTGKTNTTNSGNSGILGAINGALGGGEKGEAKEDYIDKAIDMFQERVLKEGDQSNESAIEQAKDAQIASAIRSGYKTIAGKEFPIAQKTSSNNNSNNNS